MNISKITKILEERKQAADEASKIQAVFTGLEKVCSENGFESYSSFLKAVAALEGSTETGNENPPVVKVKKSKKPNRKEKVVATQELVDKMKQAVENKGEKSFGKIADSLGISVQMLGIYRKNGFKFAPKKKGRKPASK